LGIVKVLHSLSYSEILNVETNKLTRLRHMAFHFHTLYNMRVFRTVNYVYLSLDQEEHQMNLCLRNIFEICSKFHQLLIPTNENIKFKSNSKNFSHYEVWPFSELEMKFSLVNNFDQQNEINRLTFFPTHAHELSNREAWKKVLNSYNSPEEISRKFHDGICPICLDEINEDFILMLCKHTTCTECITGWIKIKKKWVHIIFNMKWDKVIIDTVQVNFYINFNKCI